MLIIRGLTFSFLFVFIKKKKFNFSSLCVHFQGLEMLFQCMSTAGHSFLNRLFVGATQLFKLQISFLMNISSAFLKFLAPDVIFPKSTAFQ